MFVGTDGGIEMTGRTLNKLSSHQIPKLGPGKHNDGGGLALHVKPSGTRSWLLRITVKGKRRDFGLGPFPAVPLAKARERAQEYRDDARDGRDPLARQREEDRTPTFEEAANRVWETKAKTFRSERHTNAWISSLRNHAFDAIGGIKVNEVTATDVVNALGPIWHKKAETASKTLQRIREVFNWAEATDLISGANPADKARTALGKQNRTVRHHPSLPWREAPAFYELLCERDAISAQTLKFAILTAVRSGEARNARWEHIDFDAKLWTIPGEQMKAGKEHRIPLSTEAIAVLLQAGGGEFQSSGLVFAGYSGKPQSDVVFARLYERMGVSGISTHGFRTTFRVWIEEETNYKWAAAETAIAHNVGNATERAYVRTDYLDERRRMMQEWSDFVTNSNR